MRVLLGWMFVLSWIVVGCTNPPRGSSLKDSKNSEVEEIKKEEAPVFNAGKDFIFFVEGKNKIRILNAEHEWELMGTAEFSVLPQIDKQVDVKKSQGRYLRVVNQSIVEFSIDGKDFIKPAIIAAGENQTYYDVNYDAEYNYYVDLGGDYSGFNFISADLHFSAFAGIAKWDTPEPELIEKTGNPYGAGLVGFDLEGTLWHILPAKKLDEKMQAFRLSEPQAVTQLKSAGGKIYLKRQDGTFGYLKAVGDLKDNFEEIALPVQIDKTAPRLAFRSSQERNLAEQIKELELFSAVGDLELQPGALELGKNRAAEAFLFGTEKFVSDNVLKMAKEGRLEDLNVWGRQAEYRAVIRTFVREKGKNPVLLGKAGVGKTAIAELLALNLFSNQIPEGLIFQEELRNAFVVETSPNRINKLNPMSPADAVDAYIASLKACERILNRPIIVFIDEIHTFDKDQLEALKTELDSRDGFRLLGSTTYGEFTMMLDLNPALDRRLFPITVREFSVAETRELMMQTMVPRLERRYRGDDGNGQITEAALDAILRLSPQYLPGKARPAAPYALAQDVLIWMNEKSGKEAPLVTDLDVGNYVSEAMQLPINPVNPKVFAEQIRAVREKLKNIVVDQEQYTDALVDALRNVYLGGSQKESISIVLALGPTGAGKTFGAIEFAKLVFGSEERVLEIDATKYLSGGASLGTLIGVGRGIVSGTETKGVLPDFLSGPGKGANVIVINEIDKADPDFMKIIMEMLDTGKLQGGNGETFYLGKSIVVFTSNKGDDQIFPKNIGKIISRAELKERIASFNDARVKDLFTQPSTDDLYDKSKLLPPSILGRIKRAIAVLPPSYEGAIEIVRQTASREASKYKESYGFTLSVSEDIYRRIVDKNYIFENGVRNLIDITEDLIKASILNAVDANLQLDRGQSLHLSLEDKGHISQVLAKVENQPEIARLEYSRIAAKNKNPLEDPEQRAKLRSLEAEMNKRVIGQTHAVSLASQKLMTRSVFDSGSQAQGKPTTLLFMGTTGTGKTELAKVIAEVYFGSRERIEPFDLGNVQNEADLNVIFGSPRGYVGSGSPSAFEQALIKYPDGAVLLFDELGNLGGGGASPVSMARKDQFLKMFYAMVDEGRWRSGLGKVYDLSKYILIFTTNDGQETMAGLPSDDLRRAVWEEHRDAEAIAKLLREAGWPEPLVGRLLSSAILFEPLMAQHCRQIAEQIIIKALKQPKESYKLQNLDFAEGFFTKVASSFFSHSSGGRSMGVLGKEGPLLALLSRAIVSLDNPQEISERNLSFELDDNYYGKFTFTGKIPPKRKVVFRLKMSIDGGEDQIFEAEVTHLAAEKRLRRLEDLRRTAIHEAGHVVGNVTSETGTTADFVTIVGQGNYNGYVRPKEAFPIGAVSRKTIIAHLAMMLAGRTAEALAGFEPNAGWQSDWEKTMAMAARAVRQFGLVDNPYELPLDGEGKVNLAHPDVQKEVHKLMLEAREYAKEQLIREWPTLYLIYTQLLKKQVLTRQEIDEILAYAKSPKYREELEARSLDLPSPKQEFIEKLSSSKEVPSIGFHCTKAFK